MSALRCFLAQRCKKGMAVFNGFATGRAVVAYIWLNRVFRETDTRLGLDFNPFRNYQSTQTLLWELPESILNLVLFVPVGFLLGVVFRHMTWWKVLLTGVCLSMSIEILQLTLQKGCCDFNDLISNTLGCMIGYGVFRMVMSCLPTVIVSKVEKYPEAATLHS